MIYKSQIETLIVAASAPTDRPLALGKDFYVLYQPTNHTPQNLPSGKMAVYSFVYKDAFLKIGQANRNSNNRYKSHHYYINGGKSTLAKSLVSDVSMRDIIVGEDITSWIKRNCERYDVIIDADYGKFTLNFIEGLLHHQFCPKYER